MLMPSPDGHAHRVGGRSLSFLKNMLLIQHADKEVMALLQERSPQDIRKLQLDDPTIGPLLQAVEKDDAQSKK